MLLCSVLILAFGGGFTSSERHPRPCDRTDLRLRCLRDDIGVWSAFPIALQCSWSESSGRCALACSYRRVDGPVPGESSARRSNYAHRGARNHLPPERTLRYRGRSHPAHGAGFRHQSDRRNSLPRMEQPHARCDKHSYSKTQFSKTQVLKIYTGRIRSGVFQRKRTGARV